MVSGVRGPQQALPENELPSPRRWRRASCGLAGLMVVAGAALSLILSFGPPMGESVPTSPPGQLIAAGTDPGPYSTDPPTSGVHFPVGLRSGFYEPESAATLPRFAAGYLVANLERGDVIVWYNCEALESGACTDLKGQIRSAMDLLGGEHIIAFPWPSLEQPVVLTAWGRILRLPSFDLKRAIGFIFAHRGRSATVAATPTPSLPLSGGGEGGGAASP